MDIFKRIIEDEMEEKKKKRQEKSKGINYNGFFNQGGAFVPVPAGTDSRLKPGVYRINPPNSRIPMVYFSEMSDFQHDNILELPSSSYQQVVSEIDTFLEPKTKAAYEEFGFVYKRSMLLYGPPGTGKSVLVARAARRVVELGGIVLYDPDPRYLVEAYKMLSDIQPDVLTMVVFEEFDDTVKAHEQALLPVLDGEVQKNNIIYMATTNHINRIDKRLLRPGRFSQVIKCGLPGLEERKHYFRAVLKDTNEGQVENFAEMTSKLSVDELKDIVLSTQVFSYPLEDSVALLQARKK